MKLGTQGSLVSRLFSLEELEEATNKFDSSMFMGESPAGKVSSKVKTEELIKFRRLCFVNQVVSRIEWNLGTNIISLKFCPGQ